MRDGHSTASVHLLTGLGSGFSDVNGVVVTGGTEWIAGEYLDASTGLQHTLVAATPLVPRSGRPAGIEVI